jgi:hypothetical protein
MGVSGQHHTLAALYPRGKTNLITYLNYVCSQGQLYSIYFDVRPLMKFLVFFYCINLITFDSLHIISIPKFFYHLWAFLKWNLFAVLLVNMAGHRWSHCCVHDTAAIDHLGMLCKYDLILSCLNFRTLCSRWHLSVVFIINVLKGKISYYSIINIVGVYVPTGKIRDFYTYSVGSWPRHSMSARCASAENGMCRFFFTFAFSKNSIFLHDTISVMECMQIDYFICFCLVLIFLICPAFNSLKPKLA